MKTLAKNGNARSTLRGSTGRLAHSGGHMTRFRLAFVTVCALLLAAVLFTPGSQAQGNSQGQRGYAIAPVPLNTRGLNPALVGEGSYIVNAQGGCNDCHTAPAYAPGHDPFVGQPEAVNAARYLGGGGVFG